MKDPGASRVTTLGVTRDVPWAPAPNSLSCVLGPVPPGPITSTFLFVTCGERVLLVDVASRGWDLPGGHLEPGETFEEAWRRELSEEAGVVLEGTLSPRVLGALRLHVEADRPDGYPYPYPDSTMLALHVEVPSLLPVASGVPDEVSGAAWVPLSDVLDLCGAPVWAPFLAHLS